MSIDKSQKLKGKSEFWLPARFIVIPLLFLVLISGFATTAAAMTANALGVIEAPVIDLNGLETPGLDYATTFVEDDGAINIVADSLTITTDGTHISSATISLNDNPDKSLEELDITADLIGTNIQKFYSSGEGILRLTGSADIENYETVLQSVTYLNSSQAPNASDREVAFTISVGSIKSEPAISTVAILSVNDAPVLDNSGDTQLDPIDEDDQAQIGNYVATIIASAEQTGIDPITDPDGIGPEGIAVIDAGDSNGTWEFSLDSGASWSRFGTVSNSSAILLDETARIRFLPNENYNGSAGFIFRAWDQTTEETSGERADASINGGTSAFSVATESVTIEVLAINDPPVVDLNGVLPGEEFAASFLSKNAPVPITAPDAFVDDVESSEIISLMVTLTNRPDGLQESLEVMETRRAIKVTEYDPSTGELHFDGVAPLEDYSAVLRGISYLNQAENMNTEARVIEFIASDGTDNSQLTRATLVSVLSNVAPVLDSAAKMHFTTGLEDDSEPDGDAIAMILTTAESDPIQDVDPNALRGFAVVEAENANGVWQFSIDAGQTWLPLGQVSDGAAMLLNEQAKIRFLPDPNFGGESRSITVRAWDQTEGSNGIGGIDTTTNGGVSAFSLDKVSIPLTVQPINDAPVVTITKDTVAQYIEDNGAVVIAGPALHIDDIDNEQLQAATVTITNMPANEPDVLGAVTNGSGISATYDETTGTLRLRGKGSVADYQAILRSVTFNNLSQDPAEEDRLITFIVHDGSNSSKKASSTVRVEAVNDVPRIDLNGEDAPGTHNSVYFDHDGNEEGGSVYLARAMQIQDADNTTIIAATVTIKNRPDGTAETLSASTEGTNITAMFSDERREIKFSGQESLAAYQKVLRTLVYTNRLPYANRAVREVSFSVQDASLGISTEKAKVIVRPQYIHFPVIAGLAAARHVKEEPNDNCQEAVPIPPMTTRITTGDN